MAPRKRIGKNKELVDNVYSHEKGGKTYYSYRHPITKKYHGIGSDKAVANSRARVLNSHLIPDCNRVNDILGIASNTIAVLIGRYKKEMLPEKKLAESTLKLTGYRLDRLEADLGEKVIEKITVQVISEYLDKNFKKDSYIKHRGVLSELFRFAITKGYRNDNPVEVTLAKSDYGKSRKRLKLSEFKAIHEAAPEWMKIAMELSLVTLQGRHEICNMKYADIKDEHIYVVRQKTKKNEWAHIRIALTPTINELIQRSRKSGVVTPYIIHREPERRIRAKDRQHWTQLTLNNFSKRFKAIRDEISLFKQVPPENRPTFHEIRALGSWLYEKEGYDRAGYVQKLMAHADEKMTEHYQSGHEQKWLDVNADLTLKSILKL